MDAFEVLFLTPFSYGCTKQTGEYGMKYLSAEQEKVLTYLMTLVLTICLSGILFRNTGDMGVVTVGSGKVSQCPMVVIDPGHGGYDPGKVGNLPDGTQVYEKDLNLAIAQKVKGYLEQNDILVVITRQTDEIPLKEGNGSKKERDMKTRVEMVENTKPDVVVSIHQNSFPDVSVKGAQAFYYMSDPEGKKLAGFIQKAFVRYADKSNRRVEKSDSTYYLLKHSSVPTVIAECGFLTNPEECEKLTKESYADRIAWAVAMGTLNYLSAQEKQNSYGVFG